MKNTIGVIIRIDELFMRDILRAKMEADDARLR